MIHHHQFAWYCKANNKTNLSRLKTKKRKLCSYIFKYSNCKDNHQANSNKYLFWRHRFNREWYLKEYSELCKIYKQLICLSVDGNKLRLSKILKSFHIQELSWSTIHLVLSSRNCEGNELVGVLNYSSWLTFSRSPMMDSNIPRVVTYVNIRLLSFCFSI